MPGGPDKARSTRRGRRLAFWVELARGVRGSLGRFLAIMGIVALGCGFFAGLQASGADMRLAADRYYDETRLWDLRVISTLGLDVADLERLAEVDGVEDVMPSRSVDAMARLGDEQLAVRISSIRTGSAESSRQLGSGSVESDDDSYLNRLLLRSGRWPEGPDECVVCSDAPVKAGEGQKVDVLYGGKGFADLFEARRLEVVGTVSSPDHPYTGSLGSTKLGSGSIEQLVFVGEEAFKDASPYSEAYLTVRGAREELSESDAYFDVVGRVKAALEGKASVLERERQEDLRAKAQSELDEKWAEYEEQHGETYGKLAEAKAELDDAEKSISSGRASLDAGQAEYEEGLSTYRDQKADAERQLADAQGQIDEQRDLLDQKEAALAAAESEWREGYDALSSALATQGMGGSASELLAALDDRLAQLASAREQLEALKAQRSQIEEAASQREALVGGIAQARSAVERLEEAKELLQEGFTPQMQEQLDQARAQLEQLEQSLAGLDASVAYLPELEAGIATIESQLPSEQELEALAAARESAAKLVDSESRLVEGRRQLEDGRARLDAGQAELDQKKRDANESLASAKDKLDAAARELASSRQRLDDARARYEEGLAEYRSGKDKADRRFFDARRQLEDAQEKIDSIELPDFYVLDRGQSEGAATYSADSKRIDSIANVFPLFFFLVAALVSLTTMTRMVEDERMQIGSYKALGYGKAQIALRYLLYAGLAAGTGAVLGIALLSQLLPHIIMSSYSIIYALPPLGFPLPVEPRSALLAGGLGVGVTLLATWAAVISSLRETPASLLLPRAPKPGKRILLERMGPLWARVSFSWKVTLRNLFRYKRRLLMTVIGISGCAALLLVGLGLHDSIWDIIDRQFGPIVHYDTTVGLSASADELDVSSVVDFLESTGEVEDLCRVQETNMQATGPGEGSSATDTTRVSVVVPRASAELRSLVSFRERLGGARVDFTDDSVLVSEKLATLCGVGVGDQVTVYEQDEVGNAVGEGLRLTVTGVVENYVGNYVYVGRGAWWRARQEVPAFSTILANCTKDPEARSQIARELHGWHEVSTVLFSEETIDTYRSMLSAVNAVVVVLVVSAAALAFIVLYNLTNINIGERVREIASLKVLGFTRREVYAYIFREIWILSLLGDVLGMFLGAWLENFVVTTAEVDYVMFGREIHPQSFAVAFALTLLFTGLVLLAMRHKLDGVDMVESLKSVE